MDFLISLAFGLASLFGGSGGGTVTPDTSGTGTIKIGTG